MNEDKILDGVQDDQPKSFAIDIKNLPRCKHYFFRRSATTIECNVCHMGLIDMGKFKLENGNIVGT